MFQMCSAARRFLVVKDLRIFWWANEGDAAAPRAARANGGPLCLGSINFLADAFEIEENSRSSSIFTLRPRRRRWREDAARYILASLKRRTRPTLQGASRRALIFDTRGSEHPRSHWIAVLSAHLAQAEHWRGEGDATLTRQRSSTWAAADCFEGATTEGSPADERRF